MARTVHLKDDQQNTHWSVHSDLVPTDRDERYDV